jgi:hypothetical protein
MSRDNTLVELRGLEPLTPTARPDATSACTQVSEAEPPERGGAVPISAPDGR